MSIQRAELPSTLRWVGGTDGYCDLLDQTQLPGSETRIEIRDLDTMIEAIRRLSVRGAPAIGIAAAYGLVLGTCTQAAESPADFTQSRDRVIERLQDARPTAVNLAWALERIRARDDVQESSSERLSAFLDEALAIHDEDRRLCDAIGNCGATLVKDGMRVLTHCNAGALATGGRGTALGVLSRARELGRQFSVYADETRPLLQGARLTTWELMRLGIPTTLLCDGAAASTMRDPGIDMVIVGADRISACGDVANKIGTYSVALAAKAHDIPFYVAAPSSTFDMATLQGADIPIELRSARELTHFHNQPIAPEGVQVHAPAFDVTPAALVTGLITERGLISPVSTEAITEIMSSSTAK